MADPKILAWGVLCGSGGRAGKLHLVGGAQTVEVNPFYARCTARDLDGEGMFDNEEVSTCGPHSCVPLGVVERAE